MKISIFVNSTTTLHYNESERRRRLGVYEAWIGEERIILGNVVKDTLREERRLRVFENRMLTRIFGPKRDKVTGE